MQTRLTEDAERVRSLLRPDGVEELLGDPPGGSRVALPEESGVSDTPGEYRALG